MAEQLVWDVSCFEEPRLERCKCSPLRLKAPCVRAKAGKVTVKNDGQTLVNGTYTFNLKVKSNETPDSNHKVQVSLKVTGNKPALKSAQLR